MEGEIRAALLDFIITSFLLGDSSRAPQDEESLVESGVIDSTGVLELIEFLEERFGIEVAERDTVPSNLDTVANLTAYVQRMRSGTTWTVPATEARLSG